MGVYINMEMPKSCDDCRLNNGISCYAVPEYTEDGVVGRTDDRPGWCPLSPVPPHGDLIDRDATIGKIGHLADEIDKKLGYEKSAPYIMMTLYLNNADEFPTIIPAEEDE